MLTRFIRSFDGTSLAVTTRGDERSDPAIFVYPWTIATTLNDFHTPLHERVAARRFVATYDRRGTGASSRDVADLGLDAQVNDVLALADGLRFPTPDVVGFYDSTLIAIAYAARFPGRIGKLVLWHPYLNGDDWIPRPRVAALVDLARTDWALALRTLSTIEAPRGPVDFQRSLAKGFSESFTPEMFVRSLEALQEMSVEDEAREVQAETLVLFPAGAGLPIRYAQQVASLVPHAKLMSLQQSDTAAGDEAIAAIIRFLGDEREAPTSTEPSAAGTAIILFADLVDSTALTERMGDAAFRDQQRALDARLRAVIEEFGGKAVAGRTMGDGVLASFDSARDAIAAALQLVAVSNDAGMPLHLGIHAGDILREDDADGRRNVWGGAVNIAARISGLTAPGEILVSATVREIARTSASVTFEDRGEHALKGVADPQRVYAVRQGGG